MDSVIVSQQTKEVLNGRDRAWKRDYVTRLCRTKPRQRQCAMQNIPTSSLLHHLYGARDLD